MKKNIFTILSILTLFLTTGCEQEFEYYTEYENSDAANTVLYYTTDNNTSSYSSSYYEWEIDIVSNTYSNSQGKMVLRGKESYIPKYLFKQCSNLKHISIPEGITQLNDECFYNCYHLSSISLPKSLETIGSNVFSSCTNLKTITLHENINSIDARALAYSSLETVYIKTKTPPGITNSYYTSANNFLGDEISVIYVPEASVETYKKDSRWKYYSSYIKAYDFINNHPVEEVKDIVTGKYYFSSFINSDNKVLYNTITVTRKNSTTYTITSLLYPSDTEWEAIYDKTKSQLVLSGKCSYYNSVSDEYRTLDNGFMNLYSYNPTDGRAWMIGSWTSKTNHYSKDEDGVSQCIIKIDKATGKLAYFETYLSEELFEYDAETNTFGNHLGYSRETVNGYIYYGEQPYQFMSKKHDSRPDNYVKNNSKSNDSYKRKIPFVEKQADTMNSDEIPLCL